MPDGLAGAVDWCLAEVRRLPGVVGCRDPHVWEVKAGAGEVVGTVHVQVHHPFLISYITQNRTNRI